MFYCLIYILCSTFWNAFVEKSCSKLFADPPSALQVVNITHRSVQLEWQPGFHGGMDQYFRLEYNSNGKSQVRFFLIIIKLSQSMKGMKIRVAAWFPSNIYPVRKLKSRWFHWTLNFYHFFAFSFTWSNRFYNIVDWYLKELPIILVLICCMKNTLTTRV